MGSDKSDKKDNSQEQFADLIGLGNSSARKSYFPELQKKIWELEEEKNRYERIFSDALNGIFQARIEGKMMMANPAMIHLCGYSSMEQIIQLRDIGRQLFVTPDEKDNLVNRIFEEGPIIGFETQFKKADGSIIDVSLNASMITIADEQYLECFVQDISERKKAEKDLIKTQCYLSSIIDSMPSVLVGVDLEGVVTQWNLEAERMTGIPAKEAVGKSYKKVIPRLKSEDKKIKDAIITQHRHMDIHRVSFVNGKSRYEDIAIYPLVNEGGEQGAVIRIDDVSKRVQMEEVMAQSEKMMMVGGLAAGMAHEINNPLAGMLQTADVMHNRLLKVDLEANVDSARQAGTTMEAILKFMKDREVPTMLENIHKSGVHAAEIVANMLSFAHKSDLALATHNMVELLEQAIVLSGSDFDLKKRYDFRDIEIIREYEDDLPAIICGAGEIQQVIMNVLRNGAEAMHEVREANSEFKSIFTLRLYTDKPAGQLCLEIEDNGPGMSHETCKRVFEPFFTTKSVGQGIGLGLSVSYFIIKETHHGEMLVESEEGKGARFIIKLPLER